MKPNPSMDLTLYPSRVKISLCFLSSAVWTAGGMLLGSMGDVLGYVAAGFGMVGLTIFGFQFHRKAAYLHLSSDGFTFCSGFRAHKVRWAEVEEFVVVQVGFPSGMVAWNFTSDAAALRGRRISRAVAGWNAALPNSYGMAPQVLAALLNGQLPSEHAQV